MQWTVAIPTARGGSNALQPGPDGSDGSGESSLNPPTNIRVRLKENPVHEHFTYSSQEKKSVCKTCKVSMAGKNSTSLSKFPLVA
jgi:hypothetical protein